MKKIHDPIDFSGSGGNGPIFGFGADRAGDKVGFYSPGGQLTIDSYYLSILMDYGFLGFIVFYGLIICAIVAAIREAGEQAAVGAVEAVRESLPKGGTFTLGVATDDPSGPEPPAGEPDPEQPSA